MKTPRKSPAPRKPAVPSGLFARSTKLGLHQRLERMSIALARYGATNATFGFNSFRVLLAFGFRGRAIRMTLGGLAGCSQRQLKMRAAVFELALKAKLESVIYGVESVEDAFLAHLVLESNDTVGEWAQAELGDVARHPMPSTVTRPRLLRVPESSALARLPEASKPVAPRPAPVRLPIVAIEEITSPSSLFRCHPMRATLSASSCVRQQADAQLPYDRKRMGRARHPDCVSCPDGQRVTAALDAHRQPQLEAQ